MCRCKCAWWMMLEWNVFADGACSIGFDLYPSHAALGVFLGHSAVAQEHT